MTPLHSDWGSKISSFAAIASTLFSFLGEFGFSQTETSATILRYAKDESAVAVYMRRRSYELGFEFLHAATNYSMSELIRAIDPSGLILIDASQDREQAGSGIVVDILLGIVGAVVGGFIFTQLGSL